MCDCDKKLLLLVGKIDGSVEAIKEQQATLYKTVTDNQVASQKEFKDLSKDITKVKIRIYGGSAILATIAGFLARYIPS